MKKLATKSVPKNQLIAKPIEKIVFDNYQKFLSQIQNHIQGAQTNIIHSITRQKVVMAWEIGKSIFQYLAENKKAGFGEELIEKLSGDILISKTTLYEMHSFYKAYPKLPEDKPALNWSHYRSLSRIRKTSERQYFEELAEEKNWDVRTLEKKMIQVSAKKSQKISKDSPKNSGKNSAEKIIQLKPNRGKLFSYSLIKIPNTNKIYIDCGFGIFREVKERLPESAKNKGAVQSSKNGENYSLFKSEESTKKFNTYKAYLKRVVDGDTIHFIVDLGFEILHEEIIRLAKINAPEMATAEGKKSAKFLTDLLKDVPFFVIKTMKTDIYGRYVADVFLPFLPAGFPYLGGASLREQMMGVHETDATKIADSGVYLNQLLLDKKMVMVF